MKLPPFRMETLDDRHQRSVFRCGEEVLDRYFQSMVTQDIRRHVANCFVAVESATGSVAAWYTMAATSIPLVGLPPDEVKRLPRYPVVPAVLIGRLAVDKQFQGRGLGAALLADAVDRTLKGDVAAFAILVDAKNDRASSFYQRPGFRNIIDRPQTVFLPLATARKVFTVPAVQ